MSKELAPVPPERTLVPAYRTTIDLGEADKLQHLMSNHPESRRHQLYSGCQEEADSPINYLEVSLKTESDTENFKLSANLDFDYQSNQLEDTTGIQFSHVQPDLLSTLEENLVKSEVFTDYQIQQSTKPSHDQRAVFELSPSIFAFLVVRYDHDTESANFRLQVKHQSDLPEQIDEEADVRSTPDEREAALTKFCQILAHAHDAISGLYGPDEPQDHRHLQFDMPQSEDDIPHRELLSDSSLRFDDIAGYQDTKQELLDLALVYEHPELADNIGLTSTHGVLLHGPPGTGKTSLLRALAGETQAELVDLPISEIIDKYVGQSAKNIDEVFQAIRQNPAKQVVLMDEFDSLGVDSGKASSSERVDALNRLKEHIVDIAENHHNVLLTAATNNIDRIDKSLLRPGRMQAIEVPPPSEIDRRHIWSLMLGKLASEAHFNQLSKPDMPTLGIDKDVDTVELARQTDGMVGAHLNEIINSLRRQRLRSYLQNGDMPDIKQDDLLGAINKLEPEV